MAKKDKKQEVLEHKHDEAGCPDCGGELYELDSKLMKDLFLKLGKAISSVLSKRMKKVEDEEDSGDLELLLVLSGMAAELGLVMGFSVEDFVGLVEREYYKMEEIYDESEGEEQEPTKSKVTSNEELN